MFTHAELLEAAETWSHAPVPLRFHDHWHRDFVPAASEQLLHVHRGWRRDFPGPLEFWLASTDRYSLSVDEVLLPDEFARRIEQCLCAPSSAEEYAKLWGSCHGLQRPSGIEGLGDLLRVLKMADDWNDQAYLLETPEEFAAVYWSTSA